MPQSLIGIPRRPAHGGGEALREIHLIDVAGFDEGLAGLERAGIASEVAMGCRRIHGKRPALHL